MASLITDLKVVDPRTIRKDLFYRDGTPLSFFLRPRSDKFDVELKELIKKGGGKVVSLAEHPDVRLCDITETPKLVDRMYHFGLVLHAIKNREFPTAEAQEKFRMPQDAFVVKPSAAPGRIAFTPEEDEAIIAWAKENRNTTKHKFGSETFFKKYIAEHENKNNRTANTLKGRWESRLFKIYQQREDEEAAFTTISETTSSQAAKPDQVNTEEPDEQSSSESGSEQDEAESLGPETQPPESSLGPRKRHRAAATSMLATENTNTDKPTESKRQKRSASQRQAQSQQQQLADVEDSEETQAPAAQPRQEDNSQLDESAQSVEKQDGPSDDVIEDDEDLVDDDTLDKATDIILQALEICNCDPRDFAAALYIHSGNVLAACRAVLGLPNDAPSWTAEEDSYLNSSVSAQTAKIRKVRGPELCKARLMYLNGSEREHISVL